MPEAYLDTLVMKSQACPDTLVEDLTRLSGGIDVSNFLALHVTTLVVETGLDDTVPNRLGNNVLRRLFAIQAQTETDVPQGDARVGQRHHPNTRFDDVLSQTEDEGVRAILSERSGMCGYNVQEAIQITHTD